MSLYTADMAITALDNIPRPITARGKLAAKRRAGRNLEATLATGAKAGVITETWFPFVKQGIFDAAPPNIRFQTEPGQSVMTWWDAGWANGEVDRVIHLHDALRTQWDERRAQAELLEIALLEGRAFWLVGAHPAPIKRRLPIVYRAGERAHASARANLTHFLDGIAFPAAILGDLNSERLLNPDRIAGTRVGNGIVHGEFFDGSFATWGKPLAHAFKVESDHPGVFIRVPVNAVAR